MDATIAPEARYCSECGQATAPDNLARFGDRLICPLCKDRYAQKLREGVMPAVGMRYAGFWIRVLAALIDSVILGTVSSILEYAMFPSMLTPAPIAPGSTPFDVLGPAMARAGSAILASTLVSMTYSTGFIGALGATPGLMALGLKVVRPDGAPIGYGRALARYFAAMLSAMILGIGYVLVAFDSEKRALHDMICDTRVIKTRE
ncbi:MAG: RDD family protein [Bryobacteraceae bacterium]|jgi:uncharacterized RDD family membrane protein YckC